MAHWFDKLKALTWRRWLAPLTAISTLAAAFAGWAAVDTYRKSILLEARLSACARLHYSGRLALLALTDISDGRETGADTSLPLATMNEEMATVAASGNELFMVGPRAVSRRALALMDKLITTREAALSSTFDRNYTAMRIEEATTELNRLQTDCRSALGLAVWD